MTQNQAPLKIDAVASRFAALLAAEGTAMETPALLPTWRAFTALCREPVDCDDDRLFFEADLSATEPDAFYVHFVRTFFGRGPMGHEWTHEVICDFLFPLDEELEVLHASIEAEELHGNSPERENFLGRVEGHEKLWRVLSTKSASSGQIYVGES